MTSISINWFPAVQLSDIGAKSPESEILDGKGGIHLWVWNPRPDTSRPMITYIGRTTNFAQRLGREIADTVGFGGTYLRLEKTDEHPVETIKKEPGAEGVYSSSSARVRFRWGTTPEEDRKKGLLGFLAERAAEVLDYLKQVCVICGRLSDQSRAGEIEGGFIDYFVKEQGIRSWPKDTCVSYIIGRRTNRCCHTFLLTRQCEGKAIDTLAGVVLPKQLEPSP